MEIGFWVIVGVGGLAVAGWMIWRGIEEDRGDSEWEKRVSDPRYEALRKSWGPEEWRNWKRNQRR